MRIPLIYAPVRFVFVSLSLSLSLSLLAEGSREVAPNGSIVISGNNTTDVAALLIDNDEYNNFATYDNADPNSRLNIHIVDPANECIFLGFTFGHINQTSMNPARIPYEFRIRDPNGNIVYGPVMVDITGGNITGWQDAVNGPSQIYGAGGYNAMEVTSADLMSMGWSGPGDYFIEFDDANTGLGLLIDFWDISVANCSVSPLVEEKGRIWSYNWAFFAINDFGFPNRPFNGAFYVCAPDPDDEHRAFITKIDFNQAGFRPAAFNVAFNSFGSQNTGDVAFDRRSVQGANSTQAEYSVFLNDPVDLCETAEPGEIDLLGVSRCAGDDYCIKFIASKEGQIDLLLDFDGPDDIYTAGSADVMVAVNVEASQVGIPSCVFWDGLDGLGVAVPEDAGTEIPIVISFAQGIYHFPIYDAEFMTTGFVISAIRPVAPPPLLYYDDSNISVLSGTGEPPVQLSGCMPPCHGWNVFNDPNIPGFGNLNTINSWWFSQRVLRDSVFFLPSYITCNVSGPESLCENEVVTLQAASLIQPDGGATPEIISTTWSGPAITGSNTGSSVQINGGGMYIVNYAWLTQFGDTCSSSCELQVTELPVSFGFIDTLILSGETVEINGESYDEGGLFQQVLTGTNGCDSILDIQVTILQTVVHFSLDDCLSIPTQGSDGVYTEFTPEYPEPLSCATLEAEFAHRDNPTVNTHSCTPGINDTPAICISSHDACTYDPGNEKSFVFELTVTPAPDTAVAITGLQFYERGPEMFDWINGMSGPNNYPTLYGLRVLKNDVEIFRVEDVATSTLWNLESYDFLGIDEFVVTEEAVFRFEFLGYCLVGNGEMKTAWDLDEISVIAGCVSPSSLNGIISGRVITAFGRKIDGVEVQLADDEIFSESITALTDGDGGFIFRDLPQADTLYLRASKNSGFTDGVSTLDLIRIQKHLLGLQPFTSPVEWIAADATGNESLTALDLLHVRKLILGLWTVLPSNTSWRFSDPAQSLTLTAPFDLHETIALPAADLEREHLEFRAIKIGDVNQSFGSAQNAIEIRSAKTLDLMVKNERVTEGEQYTLDVTAENFNALSGMQCALEFENAEVSNVVSGALSLENAFAITGSTVKISWMDVNTRSIDPDEVLFSIIITPAVSGNVLSLLSLEEDLFSNEAYTEDEHILDLRLNEDPVTPFSGSVQQPEVIPNPFASETEIRFSVGQAGPVSLHIVTASGALVYERTGEFVSGTHKITLRDSDLRDITGVLFCSITHTEGIQTVRMIRQN